MKKNLTTNSTTSSSKMPNIKMEDASVRIVRMKTGQDILCGYLYHEEHVIMENPLQVHMRKTERGMLMILVPWLPIELIENNTVVVDNNDILLTMEPKPSLVVYYNNSISKIDEMITEDHEFAEKDLLSDPFDEDEEYETEISSTKSILVH